MKYPFEARTQLPDSAIVLTPRKGFPVTEAEKGDFKKLEKKKKSLKRFLTLFASGSFSFNNITCWVLPTVCLYRFTFGCTMTLRFNLLPALAELATLCSKEQLELIQPILSKSVWLTCVMLRSNTQYRLVRFLQATRDMHFEVLFAWWSIHYWLILLLGYSEGFSHY